MSSNINSADLTSKENYAEKLFIQMRTNCVICDAYVFKDIYTFVDYPLLFSPAKHPITEDEYASLDFIGCLNCGCVQLRGLINPSKLYENSIYITYNTPTWRRHHELFAMFIIANIGGGSDGSSPKFLEIGGSTAVLAKHILGRLPESDYTIMDMCSIPPSFGETPQIKYIQGNCEEYEYDAGQVLIMSHVFEHLYEPRHFIEKISRNVNEIFVSIPDMLSLLKSGDNAIINIEHTFFCDTTYIVHLFKQFRYVCRQIYEFDGNSVFYYFVKDLCIPETIADDNNSYALPITANVYLLDTIKNYFIEREQKIRSISINTPNCFICPSGHYGQLTYNYLNIINKKKVLGFLDSDIMKIGSRVYGTNLQTYAKSHIQRYPKDITVIIVSERFRNEIRKELLELNNGIRFIDV